MKKLIPKITAPLACVTLTMSISSRVYANSYDIDKNEEYNIAICSTNAIPAPRPCPTVGPYK